MADDGTVRIGLEIDSSKAKTQAKKEATETGKQVGANLSSGVEDAASSTGTKAGSAIKSNAVAASSGTGEAVGSSIANSSGAMSAAGAQAGDAAGSSIRTGVLSKLSGITDDLGSIGSTMSLAITAPILSIGTASFKTSMDFDTSMSQLAGALNEPIDSIGSLRQLAIQTGQDTIYSASEAGSAMIELAKGGLTEAQIEGGALASTMQLASAGNIQLSDSANTVVRAMGAFHLSATDTQSAVNALAGSANASSADVSDVSMALSQASAQAYSAGWSIQDTTAAIAELADSGIKGSDAGTSLKTMLQSLQAPSDTAAKTIEELGLQVRDANGNMRPATEIVGELQSKLGGLSSAQRDAALQTIFGSDASRAALVLMSGGVEGYQKYTAATNDQTAAQRMADAQMGDSQKAIENAKGAIETAAISLGGALSPAVEHAADVVGDLASDFANLSDDQKTLVIQFALTAAAIGPVVKGVSGAVDTYTKVKGVFDSITGSAQAVASASEDASQKVSKMGDTMDTASGKAGKFKSALSFAADLALVAGAAYTAEEIIRTYMSANADSSGKMDDAATAADNYAKKLGTVDLNGDDVVDSQDLVAQSLDKANDKFKDGNIPLEGLQTRMKDLADSSKGAAGIINDQFGVTEDKVSYAMQSISAAATEGWGSALAATQVSGGQVSDETKNNAIAMVDAIKELPPKYAKYGDEAMRSLAATMAPYWPELKDYANMSGTQIAEIIYNKVMGISTKTGQALQLTGSTSIEQLAQGITAAANGTTLDQATTDTVDQLLDSFQSGNLPEGMQDVGTESMRNMAAGLVSQWPELAGYATMTGDQIIAAIHKRMDGTYDEGSDAAKQFASGLSAETMTAVHSAEAVSGLTLDQFVQSATQAGVSGDEAVTAYANAITNGGPASILAANGVAYATDGGLHVTDGNAAGQNVVDTYNQAIAQGDTYDQAMAKAQDAANALAAPDTASAGAGQIAKYSGGMDSQSGSLNDTSSGLASVAKRPLYGLQDESYGWGSDLIQNFGTGMSGWFDWLGGQASEAANIVSSWLHQSTADVGPLKYTDQWGGDLIDNIITDMASMDDALGEQSAKSAAIITSGFSPLQDLGFAVSGSAAINYSMMYNKSMVDNGTYAALNNLAKGLDQLTGSLPATIKDNAGISGRDFARLVNGVVR
jgi:TP901 family phage tail tape measure protein